MRFFIQSCRQTKCYVLLQHFLVFLSYIKNFIGLQIIMLSNSDDTLASFRCLFLVPVNWYQKLGSLSYFSGARNRRCIEHVQFHAGNQLRS